MWPISNFKQYRNRPLKLMWRLDETTDLIQPLGGEMVNILKSQLTHANTCIVINEIGTC